LTLPAHWAQDRLKTLSALRRDGDHAAAGTILAEMAEQVPDVFRLPQMWEVINTPVVRFVRPGEGAAHIAYLETLLQVAVRTCSRVVDPRDRAHLAKAIVARLDFRLVAHSDHFIGPLMRGRAALYRTALTPVVAGLPPLAPAGAPDGRPRLVVVFRSLQEDPETTSLLPFFEGARDSGFAVSVLAFADSASPFRTLLETAADEVAILPEDVAGAARAILERNADLLLYGSDVTAKPSVRAYLSFLRLARVQMCAVSTLMTTQSPTMDVYLGSPGHRAIGADREFSERYVEVPAPGFAFRFPRRPPPERRFERAEFGIGQDAVVLVSGANQTKLHRDLLDVWAEILAGAPDTVLVLYPFPRHYGMDGTLAADVRRPFLERGIGGDRVIVLPQLDGRDLVKRFLAICDLGLDSFPYPGVTTMVDAIEAGLPTVALRGRTLRANQGADILESVGLGELVAGDVAAYRDLVLKLVGRPEDRAALRSRLETIRAGSPGVLDPSRFATATAARLRELVSGTAGFQRR
jgi:hypothetical protein